MALLGIEVPVDICQHLQKVKVPGSRDLSDHLTMFYFEDKLSPKRIAKICEVLSDTIKDTKPFNCTIKQISSFPAGKDGVPIKGDVTSKKLVFLREEIAKALDKNKISFSKKFPDFNPHVTLSYHSGNFDKIKINPITWTVTNLVIWGGSSEERGIDVKIPLGQKTASSPLKLVAGHYLKHLRGSLES